MIKTSNENDVLIGYKKLNYPISPSQIGDFGYKGDTVVPKKQKRQKKQEWQRYAESINYGRLFFDRILLNLIFQKK